MSSGPELIFLVSSHEATRSNYPLPERDASPSYGSPPPPHPPQHFIKLPWLISATHLCSWVERWTVRGKCVAQEQNTLTQPGYKCRPLDAESTSQIVRPPCLHKRGEFMLNPCRKQILQNQSKILLFDF